MDLTDQKIPPDLVAKVPPDMATRKGLVPLLIDEENMLVGMTYPLDLETLETLRFRVGMPVRAVLCSPPALRSLVERLYGTATKASPAPSNEDVETDEDSAGGGFSFAAWLWRNYKWVGAVLALIGLGAGYYLFSLIGAVVGGLVAVAILAVLLFTVK